MLSIKTLCCGLANENCYVLYQMERSDCIVIDPGEAAPVHEFLKLSNRTVAGILLTHGHFDHIGGLAELKEETGAEVYIHSEDMQMLTDDRLNLSAFLARPVRHVEAAVSVEDGAVLELAGIRLRVLHTPGHTPGGVCYLEQDSGSIFSGDTLFQDSYGRTDFPGGSLNTLAQSITQKLFELDGDYTVYPGHMGTTRLDVERRTNPILFAKGAAL